MATRFQISTIGSVFLLFLVGISPPALASCDVEEVIELVDEGLSRKMIKEECDNRVEEAGRCSLSRVIRHAKRDMLADDIYDKCSGSSKFSGSKGPAQATRCNTAYGSCPLVFGTGPVGSSCWCQFAYGRAVGVAN